MSRRREARVLRRCAPGLGPWVFAQNNQWFILEWLEGDVVTDTEFAALNQRGELAAMAAELHRRPLSGYRLDLRRQFRRYWQQLDRRRLTPDWLRLQRHFTQRLTTATAPGAAAHGHPSGNLLATGEGLRLIDWEYAADGDVALDIAALFRGNGWSAGQQQRFCSTTRAGLSRRRPAAGAGAAGCRGWII